MSKVYCAAVCAAALLFAPAAFAVDVENQDQSDHELTVSIGDAGPVTMKLKAGEIKRDLCRGEACVIRINDSSWDAGTDEEFVVRDGQLRLKTQG